MTSELWQRLKPLYDAALDLPGAERARFVAEACRHDHELQQELEKLLTAHNEQTGTLDRPIVNLRDFGVESTLPAGRVLLNRYQVVRHIDSGGMGDVYEVADGFLQGVHVALKTILAHKSEDPDLQKRFEREVLLAREVTHPNLCPMYDIARLRGACPRLLVPHHEASAGYHIGKAAEGRPSALNRRSIGNSE